MHKPESVQENGYLKFSGNFAIQFDHQILVKKKKTCDFEDFAVLVEYRMKMKESKKIDKQLLVYLEQLRKEIGRIEDLRKSQNHTD